MLSRSGLQKLLGAALVPLLMVVAVPVVHADDEDDDDDRQAQVAQDKAEQERERQREERERQQEERDRQREERERQKQEARQRADEAKEEARQRAEEDKQRKEEEKQRLEEEKERAKEEKQRAKEELQRAKEEKQRDKEEKDADCRNNHDECDGRGSGSGHGDRKSGRTSAKVKGPVRFSVDVVNADIQVTATGKDTVSISAKNCAPEDLELDGTDDEFEGDFSEWGSCEGPVVVVVPVGSSVQLQTVQGSLKLKGSYKEIEASSVAGSIDIESGDDIQAEAVQGKVKIGSARRVHVESVAGDVEFTTIGTSPIVEIETVNGNVRWTGACAKGCRASVETFQGSSTMTLDAKTSSFDLRFATQSGKFNDQLGAQTTSNKQNVKGYSPVRAKFGKAEGTVRVETYQGDLGLKKK